MPKLEQVVRPFQAGDVFTSKSLPAVQPSTVVKPDIVVIWGKPITLQMKAIGITNLFGGQRLSEVSRTTRTRRVFNEQNENQWVDVEEIQTLRMRDANHQFHDFEFTPQA